MSRLDDLPPDQRAALSLLLRQRKSYAEVAGLLRIPDRAVHDRAHAALAVLAPRLARELPPARREEIGDYLLGQQADLAARLRTRAFLEGSPQARAWALALAAELAPIAAAALPEIPDPALSPGAAGPSSPLSPSGALSSSKLGGALLLAAIAAVVVVVVLLVTGGSGSHKAESSSAAAKAPAAPTASTGMGTTAKGSGPKEDKRIALTSPSPASKAIGAAEVLSEGSKYAFYLAAEHLPATKGFFYAVWLYNSPTSFQALGKSPAVGSDGKLQGGTLLPAGAANYHKMLLTRETNSRPTRPGQVILSGAFALH
jgi:hypothetical protein